LSSTLQLLLVNPVGPDESWLEILRKNRFADFPLLQQQQALEKTLSIYNKKSNNEKFNVADTFYNFDRQPSFGRKPADLYGLEHFTNDEYLNDDGGDGPSDSIDPQYLTTCEIGIEGLCGPFEECRQLLVTSRKGVCNCKSNFVRLENGKCVSKYKTSNPIDAIAQKLLMNNIQNYQGESLESETNAPVNPPSSTDTDTAIKPLTVSVVSKIVQLPENEASLSAFVMPDENTSGDKYTYLWTLIEQPPDAVNGTMKDQTKDKVKLLNLSLGLYRFKVSVTGKASYGEASANVSVLPKNRINTPPIVNITPKEQTVKLPNSKAILDGSASSDDEKIESWLWELVQGPIGYTPTLPGTSTLQLEDLTQAGNYTFKLTVKDTDQATNSTTATIQVLKEIDYPPEANAGTDVIIYLPHNSIVLNGSLSKDDHAITEWEWTWMKDGNDAKAVDMQKTRTPFLELSNLEVGIYTFVLKVTDAKGQTSSSTVHVFVKHASNLPPVARAGNNQTITLPKNWILLNGSESTDDNKISNFYWTQISGPNTAVLTDPNSTLANASALTVGEYIFELFVVDETNNTNADRVKVTVIQGKFS
jgi:dyslexia-associated protein KIAA0319-like protein